MFQHDHSHTVPPAARGKPPAISLRRRRAFLVLNLASIVEKMDEGVLPAVFYFIGRSLNASLSQLGNLTLSRALVQALSSPLAGVLGDVLDRRHIVATGAFLWGIMTAAIGFSQNVHQAMWFCALNGFGLALVIPAISSLVADEHAAAQRGRAFGVMNMTSGMGGMVAAFMATNMGGKEYRAIVGSSMTIEGWRVAFFCVAIVSIATAILVLFFVEDPRRSVGERERTKAWKLFFDTLRHPFAHSFDVRMGSNSKRIGIRKKIKEIASDVVSVFRVRSFQVIVLQGIVGSMPWQAMVMFTLHFQLLGFSDVQASMLMAVFSLGCALGGYLGGWLGDWACSVWPHRGRILVAQVCVLCGLPFSALLLKGLPLPSPDGSSFADDGAAGKAPAELFVLYSVVLILMGSSISWCGVNNSALFAELVPERLRTHVYAFDRSFEGAIGACGAPLVGLTAEQLFGFSGSVASAVAGGDSTKMKAARALSGALLFCLVVPWVFCFASYLFLYWTLPRDKMMALRETMESKEGDEEAMPRPLD